MPDPFISRVDLGQHLNRDLSADAGALIAVDAACDLVRQIADQTFNEVTGDVLVLDGDGTDYLVLPELPVTAIGAISVDGVALASGDYKFTAQGDLFRVNAGVSYRRLVFPVWTYGRQNVSVTYSHGYAPADMPRDVRMIALAIAARIFQQGTGSGGNVAQENLGAYSIRYVSSVEAGVAVTDDEEAILRGGYKPVLVA